jgi:hypothetical protein
VFVKGAILCSIFSVQDINSVVVKSTNSVVLIFPKETICVFYVNVKKNHFNIRLLKVLWGFVNPFKFEAIN